MPDFTYGDYVYIKENKENPNIYHIFFIFNQEPKYTIISLLSLMGKQFKLLPKMYVKK